MGQRGPIPLEKEVLAARGSWRAKDREPSVAEVVGAGEKPHMPVSLSPAAKACWRRTVRILVGAGLVNIIDTDALARYCEAFARWKEAEARVMEEGQVIEGREGPMVNPWVRACGLANQQCSQLSSKLGLTPADRLRLRAPDKNAGNSEQSKAQEGKERFFPRAAG